MKVQPLNGRVLVKRSEHVADTTAGGIFIPHAAQEAPPEGVIVAIGATEHKLCEGDKVLFGKHAGTEITFHGETLLIMRDDEILGRIIDDGSFTR